MAKLLLGIFLALGARANSIALSIDSPIFAAPGSRVLVSGSISTPMDNTSPLYVMFSILPHVGEFTLFDAILFQTFNSRRPMGIGARYSGPLFYMQVSSSVPPGSYQDSFGLNFNSNPFGGGSELLVSTPFTLTVVENPVVQNPETGAVVQNPEPGTFGLLAAGVLAVIGLGRRAQSRHAVGFDYSARIGTRPRQL